MPSRFDIHEWRIMDDFSRQLEDGDVGLPTPSTARRVPVVQGRDPPSWRRGFVVSLCDAVLEETDWLEVNGIPYRRGRYAASGEEGAAGRRPRPDCCPAPRPSRPRDGRSAAPVYPPTHDDAL